MTDLEDESADALWRIAQRLQKEGRKVFIKFKGSSQFLTPLRRSTVRDILLRSGLESTQFSFGKEFFGEGMHRGGSRDVEFIVF